MFPTLGNSGATPHPLSSLAESKLFGCCWDYPKTLNRGGLYFLARDIQGRPWSTRLVRDFAYFGSSRLYEWQIWERVWTRSSVGTCLSSGIRGTLACLDADRLLACTRAYESTTRECGHSS